jgi:hypothetical protein
MEALRPDVVAKLFSDGDSELERRRIESAIEAWSGELVWVESAPGGERSLFSAGRLPRLN